MIGALEWLPISPHPRIDLRHPGHLRLCDQDEPDCLVSLDPLEGEVFEGVHGRLEPHAVKAIAGNKFPSSDLHVSVQRPDDRNRALPIASVNDDTTR